MEASSARKTNRPRHTDKFVGAMARAIHIKQKECESWYLRGSLVCYFCVIYRLTGGKPLRNQRELAAFNRIYKASIYGIPIATLILFLFGLFILWQASEINRLHAALQAKALIEMSLAELSNINITRM